MVNDNNTNAKKVGVHWDWIDSLIVVSSENGHQPWNTPNLVQGHRFMRVWAAGANGGCRVANLKHQKLISDREQREV